MAKYRRIRIKNNIVLKSFFCSFIFHHCFFRYYIICTKPEYVHINTEFLSKESEFHARILFFRSFWLSFSVSLYLSHSFAFGSRSFLLYHLIYANFISYVGDDSQFGRELSTLGIGKNVPCACRA